MTRQRSRGSGASTSKGLLSRTVATVTIAYRACARAHAGETSGAIGTVATVCVSSVLPPRPLVPSWAARRMVVPPPHSLPTYSPSVPRQLTETVTAKGLSVDQARKSDTERPKRKVQRHSPDRLLRRPVELPGGVRVSAERHRGRIVVRVESPEGGR